MTVPADTAMINILVDHGSEKMDTDKERRSDRGQLEGCRHFAGHGGADLQGTRKVDGGGEPPGQ